MTRAQDFRATLRGGRRGSSRAHPLLAVSFVAGPGGPETGASRAGFVVSRAVGGAVLRNRVRRRLRHLVAARLPRLPAGSMLVVRALPPAGSATSAELGAAIDRALGTATDARLATAEGGRA
jgi:ribonuclease P protein component